MKIFVVLQIVLCVISKQYVYAISSEEAAELTETCCTHGETNAVAAPSVEVCAAAMLPDDVKPDGEETCRTVMASCCKQHFKLKDECSAGMKFAPEKKCSVPKSDTAKTCCEECIFARLTGESQGREACGSPADADSSPTLALRQNAFYQCCLEAVEKPTTTTEKKVETTTEKKVETTTEKKVETTTEKKVETTTEVVKEKCKKDSCEQICKDGDGKITCQCQNGFRLQADKKSCKDINECAESLDDLCNKEGTVCHNTVGSYKCVPLRKRDVGLSCPPGFKRNLQNQVCDDINECQLPRPPCPKYLCANTIGGYTCAGKPGKPMTENVPGATTETSVSTTPVSKNDICPSGFRAGPDDECVDIDECEESLDDCQRLSQYCINTHGSFFCQDHVSKRCAPGFKVNDATGKCEDIDECEESSEVCKRSEVCVNLPGAYDCKSKISTLPKLGTKSCQEGTRARPGGTCEDIDECREGTHLCDQFQNCINTYGGHECRCKHGFELDSSSGSCVDIDECAQKLDTCAPGLYCLNVLGSFTCTRRAPTTSSTTTIITPPLYEYEYYDSEEDNSTNDNAARAPTTSTSTTTRRPPTTRTTTTSTTTTPRPTTTTRRIPYRPERPRPTYRPTTTTERVNPITPRRPEPTPRSPEPSIPRSPEPSTPRRPEPFIPRRPEPSTPRRPETTSRRPETTPSRRPEIPTTPTVPIPRDPVHGYEIDSIDVPRDRRPTVIRKPGENDFDPNELHCLNGYERNERGECVDINECEGGRHICSTLEVCQNRPGGYVCDCLPGFKRDASGWCVVDTTTSTSTSTTTVRTTSTSTSSSTTTSTTTERPVEVPVHPPLPDRPSTPDLPVSPYWPPSSFWPYASRPHGRHNRPYSPRDCELGYTFSTILGGCVDVDECSLNKHTCSADEDCVNNEGGFRCVCGRRCRSDDDKPTYVLPTRPTSSGDPSVFTVGTQYGQRGVRYMRPTYTRLPGSGAIVTSCPWGYQMTPEKRCLDIDECARNISECGPQQRCENFYGGYACQCPTGHRLSGQESCDDIDECAYGSPCSYNAKCINTVGSYRCSCGAGFRNAPSNDKVCIDVDECSETPGVCHQSCANSWGSYRCYCDSGYRLNTDNRTCVDVDECAEWSTVRLRGRLCGGECINEPGSYRCSCPSGYRLSSDGRSCIDIDECENGEASCARESDGRVCQNTRGGYHCHRIDCPPGYRIESKHRCTRIQRSCPISDWNCLRQPSSYSYNFITFVANIYLPSGSVDLFTMHGPMWSDSVVSFEMRMVDVQASNGIQPAELRCFDMRTSGNVCTVSLLCSLGGPQVAELELTMSLYRREQFAGNAVARLVVIVSQYEF